MQGQRQHGTDYSGRSLVPNLEQLDEYLVGHYLASIINPVSKLNSPPVMFLLFLSGRSSKESQAIQFSSRQIIHMGARESNTSDLDQVETRPS